MKNNLKKIMKELDKLLFSNWIDKKLLFRGKTSIKILNWVYKHINFKIHLLILLCFMGFIFYSFFISKRILLHIIMLSTFPIFFIFYYNFFDFVCDEIERKNKLNETEK